MKFKVTWSYAVMVHEDHIIDLSGENSEQLLEDALAYGYETIFEWVSNDPTSFLDLDTLSQRTQGDAVGNYDEFTVEEIGVLDQIVEATKPSRALPDDRAGASGGQATRVS